MAARHWATSCGSCMRQAANDCMQSSEGSDGRTEVERTRSIERGKGRGKCAQVKTRGALGEESTDPRAHALAATSHMKVDFVVAVLCASSCISAFNTVDSEIVVGRRGLSGMR
jgi:hypothetical protein